MPERMIETQKAAGREPIEHQISRRVWWVKEGNILAGERTDRSIKIRTRCFWSKNVIWRKKMGNLFLMGLGWLSVRLVHLLKIMQVFLFRSLDILLFKTVCVFLLSIVDVYLGKWGFLWECGNQKSALSAENLECRPDNITQLSTYWESFKRIQK